MIQPEPLPSTRAELRGLLALAAPIAAAQAGLALMGVVDTAVVGRLGAAPLGAIGLANGLFFALFVVGMGVMLGFDPLIAQAIGAGEEGRARELLWQGIWLACIVAAALALPLAASPWLFGPAGIGDAIAADARAFLWFRLLGLLPMLLFIALRGYLQAIGRATPLVWATVVANLANLGFDLLLVHGGASLPGWTGPLTRVPMLGAPGAGLATSLAALLQLGVLAWAVAGERPPTVAPRRRPRLADLLLAVQIGWPIGLQMGAEVGVFALVGVLAGRLGAGSLAAHQIALSLASLTFCAAVGLGNAGSVRVGWAIGRGDLAGARRAGLVAFAAGAAFMSASACLFWALPGALAGLLSGQRAVVAAAVPLLGVAAVFQVSDGIQGIGAGVLRGAGDTRFAFAANVVGHYLVGLPIALALGFWAGWGVVGLWWGLCAGLSAVALALFTRFFSLASRPIAALATAGAVAT